MKKIRAHEFRRLDEVFSRVCVLPKSEHETALRENCGMDDDLSSQVRRLLEIDASLPNFVQDEHINAGFERCAATVWRHVSPAAIVPQQPGHFEILGILGSGGMGTVYRAQQQHPRREVALKILRNGMMTPKLVRRFEFEVDILAKLQHPGIAQLLEAGTFHDGSGARPYFAMELIEGMSLLSFANDRHLDDAQRLLLFVQVCRAVEHAHQKGVVHRDLKPANILVKENGEIKVLDFGIARSTEADLRATMEQTGVDGLMGTLAYMSPEQAAGNAHDIDTRSDVYSLGVILYELLSGKLPHDLREQSIPSAARTIAEGRVLPLRTHDRRFVGDLDTIASKATNKEPEKRYSSAAALADDIERHLRDEPIAARPPTTWEQWQRFSRRNRALAASVLLAFISLTVATGFSSWMAWREHKASVAAVANAEHAQRLSSRAERNRRLMGELFMSADDRPNSRLEQLQRQVAEARQAPNADSRRLAIALSIYARALEASGEFDLAESAIRESIHLFERLNAPRLPAALSQLAAILNEQRRSDEAKETIDKACQEAARLIADTWDEAQIHCVKSEILSDMGNYDEARTSAKYALHIIHKAVGDDHARVVRPLLAMANVELRDNQPELAVGFLKDALNIATEEYRPSHHLRIAVEDGLADALIRANLHDEAREHIQLIGQTRIAELGTEDYRTVRAINLYNELDGQSISPLNP